MSHSGNGSEVKVGHRGECCVGNSIVSFGEVLRKMENQDSCDHVSQRNVPVYFQDGGKDVEPAPSGPKISLEQSQLGVAEGEKERSRDSGFSMASEEFSGQQNNKIGASSSENVNVMMNLMSRIMIMMEHRERTNDIKPKLHPICLKL
ncbi:hypothetical protein FQR65_LT04011 [Abscondita terminalis]|nr:hypothetical protein FQR65_LT04011 [Abscondita terminalis]